MVVGKLGASEDSARAATGGLLQLIQKSAEPKDTQQLMAGLPGAQELLDKGAEPSPAPVAPPGHWRLWEWLVICALGLLLLDAWLHPQGRIP